MEFEAASYWFQCLQTSFYVLLFSLTITSSLSLFIFVLRVKFWCKCDVCNVYLTSNWSIKFDNLCDWYTHLLKNSPTRTIHIHVLGNTITANPDNIEYILKTNFDNYPKGKSFHVILGDLLGHGIFNVDGEQWKFQRKMASLELGSVSIRSYAFENVKNEIQNRLLPLFCTKEDVLIDLQDVFRRFAFDTICKFSSGLDPGCLELSLPISEFAMAFDLASKLSAERALSPTPLIWKIKRLLNLGTEKKLKEAITKVNTLADEIIQQKRRSGFNKHQDLLSTFMGTVENDDIYLRDIVISFILAGRDTVASALTSFFWLVANHPEVESFILDESNRVMRPSQELASFEQIQEMPYLQAALYESMRLYPPVQFDSKFAEKDDVLPDGTYVKKGTRVTYHTYAMGRMEELWGPDCYEFKPERWLKKGLFSPVSPFKYPVFHAGFRVCLGKELALVEMKSVVVSLIRRFEIRVVESGRAPRFSPGLTATVKGGLPVLVRKRT
ncbi:Cytochrome P450 [Macleaya cordata]|uniref:Cytochrome P450 n=1 Tax=Macleaya cordata TaxID=56857 RepID=A0A200Q6A4_MACCD|nr:Cytochrome P450 [Macleaya cordata]